MLVVSTPEPKKLACPTITNIQLINEKPLVIQEYKSGKDIPNQQIITKLERVLGVKLRAEVATDEVYAQVSSAPKSEKVEEKLQEVETTGDGGEEEIDGLSKSSTPHMFCKTLTSSNTSTHGVFSVPRRAAEDCFPPLDYRQQRPSQELIPKDLHGKEWRFRHIYRGQPRRQQFFSLGVIMES